MNPDPEIPQKFDWQKFFFKVQVTLTSRKFGALLVSLASTWTAYGQHAISGPLAAGLTTGALAVWQLSMAHEDKIG